MESKRFYVYQLIDSRTEQVFYIGKGQGKRCNDHERNAKKGRSHNRHLGYKILKILGEGEEVKIKKVFETDVEQEAFDREIELIKMYGKENLCNYADGGEGSSGVPSPKKGLTVNDDDRIRRFVEAGRKARKGMSAWNKGKEYTEEEKEMIDMEGLKKYREEHGNWNKGKTFSKEYRQKLSEAHKGKTLPEEQKRKIGQALKGRIVTEETRKKIGDANRGKNSVNYGRKYSEEERAELSMKGNSKLDRETVLAIRGYSGNMSLRELGVKYGVSKQIAQGVKSGRTYQYIK